MTTRLGILGSTGSIGRQTLAVVDDHPDLFEIVALAAGQNVALIAQQVRTYGPRIVSLAGGIDGFDCGEAELLSGDDGLRAIATHPDVDIVVVATSGHSSILPTLEAIKAGKTVALANKEAIVCAGEVLMAAEREYQGTIRPIDSEHCAIWQCLGGRRQPNEVDSITLTASGGPFRTSTAEEIANATLVEALNHPTWKMGGKVTIDSATLMNKGLEVIEAHWLFDVPFDRIGVVIHPQSLVHSFVSFQDGSVLAQFGVHDMRVPIQYALTYPLRPNTPQYRLDLATLGQLDFSPPDLERFPALKLATQAGVQGGAYPTVLSAADEIAVDQFVKGRLLFGQIAEVVATVLDDYQPVAAPLTLEHIREADSWARRQAESAIMNLERAR